MNKQAFQENRDRLGQIFLNVTAALVLVLGAATQAQAEISLSLSSGSDSILCTDLPSNPAPNCTVTGSATALGDLDPDADDIFAFVQNLGSFGQISLSASGVATSIYVQDISVTAESNGPGSIELMFTQTNLNGSGSGVMLDAWLDFSFIGSDDGTDAPATSVDFALYADSNNTAFGMEQQIVDITEISGLLGSNDVTSSGTATLTGGQFSLTQVFNINHGLTGNRVTAFTSAVNTVPEPTILGLVGLGLVLGALARRRV